MPDTLPSLDEKYKGSEGPAVSCWSSSGWLRRGSIRMYGGEMYGTITPPSADYKGSIFLAIDSKGGRGGDYIYGATFISIYSSSVRYPWLS